MKTKLGKYITEHVHRGQYEAREDASPWFVKESLCAHAYTDWLTEQDANWTWMGEDDEDQ